MPSNNTSPAEYAFSFAAWIKPLRIAIVVLTAPIFSPQLASAQADSAPKLVSTTGGGSTWSDLGELQKAAASGNPKACVALGEMYLNGDQVPKDVNRGLELLNRALKQGNADAAFRLGKLYDDGEAVPRDYAQALPHYLVAAKAGIAVAQYNLGVMYSSAHGVKRDFVEGLAWLIIATKNGADGDGEKQVRDRLTASLQAEMIANAEKRAIELAKDIHVPVEAAPPAPTKKSPPADAAPKGKKAGKKQARAASVELKAPTVVSNPEPVIPQVPNEIPKSGDASGPAGNPIRLVTQSGKLADWPSMTALERDAQLEIPAALSALGQILIDGKLAPADPNRAIGLLERGAKAGSADAAYQLGEAYTQGALVPKSDEKAFTYNLQAAHGGIVFAMFNVGAFYANGRGTTRDYSEALTWLSLAKKNGLDRGVEERIRTYLQKNEPDKIAGAEKRATELQNQFDSAAK